ncbi:MAG: Ger(x)C family spore germination protein [Acutalibacteraceae bacterium]
MTKTKITVFQLFSMLFLSRIILDLAYSAGGNEGELWDFVISAVIALPITVLLCIPSYILTKNAPDVLITELAPFGKVSSFIYSIYFVLAGSYTLYSFIQFLNATVSADVSVVFLTIIVVAAACYGAYKGIEALVRSSVLILVLSVIMMIFMICALIPKVQLLNYPPLMENGAGNVLKGVYLMISRSYGISCVAMLLPFTNGKRFHGIVAWSFAVYGAVAVITAIITGVLGSFIRTQPYPVYTAAGIAEYGVLQRLDFAYLGICTAGLFIKISLFLLIISICAKSVSGERGYKLSVPIGAASMAILAFIAQKGKAFAKFLSSPVLWIWLTLVSGFILPLIILICLRKSSSDGAPKSKKKSTAGKVACLIISMIICLNLSGCGAKQLDERLIIKGVGIDIKDGKYELTVQSIVTEGSEQKGESIQIISSTGNSVYDAVNNAVLKTGKEPMLGQNLCIILGYDTAKQDIRTTLDYFVRSYDARPTASVYISKTTAKDILTAKSDGRTITAQSIEQLAQAESISAGAVTTDVLGIVTDLEDDITDTFAPVIEKNKISDGVEELSITGTAVFRDNTVVGVLDKSQSMGVLLATGKFKEGNVTVNNDKVMFSASISNCRTDVDINNFNVYISVSVDASVYESGEYITADVQNKYRMYIEDKLEEAVCSALDKSLGELSADIFSLHNHILRDNSENYKRLLSERTLLSNENITVEIKVNMV